MGAVLSVCPPLGEVEQWLLGDKQPWVMDHCIYVLQSHGEEEEEEEEEREEEEEEEEEEREEEEGEEEMVMNAFSTCSNSGPAH